LLIAVLQKSDNQERYKSQLIFKIDGVHKKIRDRVLVITECGYAGKDCGVVMESMQFLCLQQENEVYSRNPLLIIEEKSTVLSSEKESPPVERKKRAYKKRACKVEQNSVANDQQQQPSPKRRCLENDVTKDDNNFEFTPSLNPSICWSTSKDASGVVAQNNNVVSSQSSSLYRHHLPKSKVVFDFESMITMKMNNNASSSSSTNPVYNEAHVSNTHTTWNNGIDYMELEDPDTDVETDSLEGENEEYGYSRSDGDERDATVDCF